MDSPKRFQPISLPSRRRTEALGALPQGPHSEDWWRKRSPDSSVARSKQHAPHSSLHCPLVQGSIAWATWSEQPQMKIVKRRSSPLTASGRMITFSGVPFWQSCLRCRDSDNSCHLCVPSTPARRGTFSKTMPGNDTKSINMREANRETL